MTREEADALRDKQSLSLPERPYETSQRDRGYSTKADKARPYSDNGYPAAKRQQRLELDDNAGRSNDVSSNRMERPDTRDYEHGEVRYSPNATTFGLNARRGDHYVPEERPSERVSEHVHDVPPMTSSQSRDMSIAQDEPSRVRLDSSGGSRSSQSTSVRIRRPTAGYAEASSAVTSTGPERNVDQEVPRDLQKRETEERHLIIEERPQPTRANSLLQRLNMAAEASKDTPAPAPSLRDRVDTATIGGGRGSNGQAAGVDDAHNRDGNKRGNWRNGRNKGGRSRRGPRGRNLDA